VPVDELLTLAGLTDPDYTYRCQVDVRPGDDRSAEDWARSVFESCPRVLRAGVVAGWLAGLGLRLAPRSSPSHVLGWDIVANEPEATVLGVGSRWLTPRLVIRIADGHAVHATFLRYDRWVARLLWAVARPIHELVVPYLLRRASVG
jgi:hypothetical protein